MAEALVGISRPQRFSPPVANEVTPIAMPHQPTSFPNRRTQPRRSIRLLTKIVFPDGERPPLSGFTHDLSWGGACLLVSDVLPPAVADFQLMMSWTPEQPILANACLLRSRVREDGRTQIAVRFSQLTLAHHARLVSLLEQSRHEGEAVLPLAPALEIVVNEPAQMHRLLAEIATGRLTLTVFHAYEIDQSIRFSLTRMRDRDGEGLRARIVDVQPFQINDFDWITVYRITLRFEHPLASLKQSVERQLDQALAASPHDTPLFAVAFAPVADAIAGTSC
ncbi:PilZ domain-containing protein [Thiocystis minor]|uniref:PilZ domain-containing protein n=1 Tax=Thiocystis minor TaxID=61597 RepID=UPI001911EDF9|nr:PilZ domain-containing protein [Thiocystis minor]